MNTYLPPVAIFVLPCPCLKPAHCHAQIQWEKDHFRSNFDVKAGPVSIEWFRGAKTNLSFNCLVSRVHVNNYHGNWQLSNTQHLVHHARHLN